MPAGLYDLLSLQGVALPSGNVSSELTAGFEQKDNRNTAYLHITEATFDTDAYLSLALGISTKVISAAQAKILPGVTAGETIRVYCEMYCDSLNANREGSLQLEFYDEDAVKKGDTIEIAVTEADFWDQKKQDVTVPTDATRVNILLQAGCGMGETVQVWCAHLRMAR